MLYEAVIWPPTRQTQLKLSYFISIRGIDCFWAAQQDNNSFAFILQVSAYIKWTTYQDKMKQNENRGKKHYRVALEDFKHCRRNIRYLYYIIYISNLGSQWQFFYMYSDLLHFTIGSCNDLCPKLTFGLPIICCHLAKQRRLAWAQIFRPGFAT